MSELAADGIPVAVTCRVLKLARQPYYRWLATPVTAAERATLLRRFDTDGVEAVSAALVSLDAPALAAWLASSPA